MSTAAILTDTLPADYVVESVEPADGCTQTGRTLACDLGVLAPAATRIGLMINPHNANAEGITREMAAAASAIGVQIEVVPASDIEAIHAAFATLARNKAGALVVAADPLFFNRRVQFATLAARHAIPTVHTVREFSEAGFH